MRDVEDNPDVFDLQDTHSDYFDYTTADLRQRRPDRPTSRGYLARQAWFGIKLALAISVVQVLWLLALGWRPFAG